MKQRMSRTHKHRKEFKVDCLLDRINMKNRELQPGNLEGYMTLTFLGFYDKKGNISSLFSGVHYILLVIGL
jgi:polycomb protein SUZ12